MYALLTKPFSFPTYHSTKQVMTPIYCSRKECAVGCNQFSVKVIIYKVQINPFWQWRLEVVARDWNTFVPTQAKWKRITRCGASELCCYWWRRSVTDCVCSASVSEAPLRVKISVLTNGSLRRDSTCSATKTVVEQVPSLLFCLLWFELCDCGVEYHPRHEYTRYFFVYVAIH